MEVILSMTRATFGSLPSLFWEGDLGRAIQAHGKDAVILSNYLRANRHATMIGLYRVRLDQILYEHPVLESVAVIRTAFQALHHVLFAEYDEPTAFVWVLEMARERLALSPGAVLDPEDKRRKGAQRLYDLLAPSPFVEPFFDRYGHALRLKRRNFAQPDLETVRPTEGAYKGLVSPLQGASVVVPSTVVPDPDQEDQDQLRDQEERSDRTAAPTAPRLPMLTIPRTPRPDDPSLKPNDDNYRVIQAAAWDLLRNADVAAKFYEFPIETLEDLVEATKRFCARRHIDYGRNEKVPFNIVHRATASVWFKFRHPEIVGRADERNKG